MPPVYVPNPSSAQTPADLIEDLGAEIAAFYADAEQRMIRRVRNLTVAALEDMPDITERLRILRELAEEGRRIAEQLRDPRLINEILAIAARDGEEAAIRSLGIIVDETGAISRSSVNAVAQLALSLTNELDAMSLRITRWMPDIYQRVIATITPSILLGVDTLRIAERRAAESFLAAGVDGFIDKAGRRWRIGSYAEMATRTSVNRAWQFGAIDRMQGQGINLVSIIIGVNACQKCAVHSGKIYSTDGTPGGTYTLERAVGDGTVEVTVAGDLASARASGWNHPNCRCVVVAYLPGLSIAEGTTHDPVKEKARDRLRELERRVRQTKRRQEAAFDDVTSRRYARRVREIQAEIRQHVAETGLLRRRYRESLAFTDAPTVARTAGPRAIASPPTPASLPREGP